MCSCQLLASKRRNSAAGHSGKAEGALKGPNLWHRTHKLSGQRLDGKGRLICSVYVPLLARAAQSSVPQWDHCMPLIDWQVGKTMKSDR